LNATYKQQYTSVSIFGVLFPLMFRHSFKLQFGYSHAHCFRSSCIFTSLSAPPPPHLSFKWITRPFDTFMITRSNLIRTIKFALHLDHTLNFERHKTNYFVLNCYHIKRVTQRLQAQS